MFKLDLEKAEEPEIKLPASAGSSKKRVLEKHLLLLYWLWKAFDCVDHKKLWKILKEMGIPDHLTCLLRHLYAGQETTVRTGHGKRGRSKSGKEYISSHDECETWTIKKAEWQRIDAFELWCWRRLLRVPWTAGRSNQSIRKEISPGCSLEGLMLKLKLQYFGHLMQSWLIGKDPDAGQEEKGTIEDEMVGWHHQLNGHGFG